MLRKITIFILFLGCLPKISAQTAEVRWLHQLSGQTEMHDFSRVMSVSAYVAAVGLPVTQGVVALAKHDDALFKQALCSGVGVGLTAALSLGIKYTVQRQRPYEAYPDYICAAQSEGSPTMPSAHTALAFSTATMLSLQYPKWYVIAPSYVWACGVGYSRMNLGVHYPTDVLAGAALGAGSACLTYYLNRLLWRKTNNKQLIGLQAYRQLPSIADTQPRP